MRQVSFERGVVKGTKGSGLRYLFRIPLTEFARSRVAVFRIPFFLYHGIQAESISDESIHCKVRKEGHE